MGGAWGLDAFDLVQEWQHLVLNEQLPVLVCKEVMVLAWEVFVLAWEVFVHEVVMEWYVHVLVV